MAAVTPFPFAIGMVSALLLFAAATWFLARESRRPVTFPAVRVRAEPHISHTRVVAVCVVFVLWSVWATARPVSGWR